MKAISQCLKFIQNVSFELTLKIKTLDGVYENLFPFLTIFNDFFLQIFLTIFKTLTKKVTFILKMELRLKVELRTTEENRGYEQIIKLKFPGSQKS